MADHGTRKAYQAGCRCRSCKAANAGYLSYYRRLKVMQQLPLGAKVNAYLTWKCVRALLTEGFHKQEIARELGLKSPGLQFDTEHVTLRNQLKVLRLARQRLGGVGSNSPLDSPE